MKNYELVNFCEFDKYASKSYCAVHNVDESKNLGDITKVDETKLDEFNFICGGSPCQDFSIAGKQKGSTWTCRECGHGYNPLTVHYSNRDKCPNCQSQEIDKTRSSLLVEWLRVIRANKPNFGIYENVKNIVGKQFKETTFKLFEEELHEYGYNTYWKVLNAKNYGIPQNRERVYLILIKKELDNGKFEFPKEFDNGMRLRDVLQDEVDEKYYINKEWHFSTKDDNKHDVNEIAQINGCNFKTTRSITNPEMICRCLDTMGGGQREPKVVCEQRSDEGIRFFKGDYCGALRTIDSCGDKRVIESTRIRKLTPLECWRLMGFDDDSFYRAEKVNSNSQLYKQAGNSIVVDVLYHIYKELYKAMPYLFNDLKVSSYFSGIGAFEKALDRLFNDINNENF